MNRNALSRRLLRPAAVAAIAGIAWAIGGPAGAVIVLCIGWGAFLVHHFRNLDRLTRWAEVAGFSGARGNGFLARPRFPRLYRRVRLREAHQRDLARTIQRFQAPPRPSPTGWSSWTRQSRQVGQHAAHARTSGLDDRHDVGSPVMNIVRQPEFVRFLESGDFAEPIVDRVAARGWRHARHPDRAVRHGGEPADQPRHHAAGGGRAHAPRLHRQRLARVEDAADGHRRFPGNAAGARPRREAARALRPVECRSRRPACSVWSRTC